MVGLGADLKYVDDGVSVRFFPTRQYPPHTAWLLGRLRVQRYLRYLVKHQELSIVEAPDWCGISAGIAPNCPIVIRCNGSAVYFGHILGESVRPSVQWAENMAIKRASGVAAVSRYTAEETQRLFQLNSQPVVILNGIDTTQFSATGEPGSSDQSDQTPTILYLGTIVRKKGVLDVCKAFSDLIGKGVQARLHVVGRDSHDKATSSPSTWDLCKQYLTPEAQALTKYMGSVPHTGVRDALMKADMCVFPSYAEAMPLAWIEAMSCAKPIIAYNIGWASEVVQNDKTGILVPKGDTQALTEAMASMIANPDRRHSMGQSARERAVAYFSVERAARQTIAWYNAVLEARHERAA